MGRASKYEAHREQILTMIRTAADSHGRAPTVRDLANACGVGVATVHSYLTKLSEEGLVEWSPKSHRTLRPTPLGSRQ